MNRATSLFLIGMMAGVLRAGPNRETIIGPSGGSAHALAVDPANPRTVYAGTSAGVLKTTDGGLHCRAANSGLPAVVRTLVIDTSNPNALYASSSATGPGLFR